MASSDERREVAAWLRMQVGEEECIDYAVFRIINDVLGVNGAWGAKAAHILADLIDQTCEVMEVPDNDEFMVRVVSGFVCKRCGHEAIVERNCDGSAEPPRFCPHCGCRVVSHDDN